MGARTLGVIIVLSLAPGSALANRPTKAAPAKTQKSTFRAKVSATKAKLGRSVKRVGTTLRFRKSAAKPAEKPAATLGAKPAQGATPGAPSAKPAASTATKPGTAKAKAPTPQEQEFHNALARTAQPISVIARKIAKSGSHPIRRAKAVRSGDTIFLLNVEGGKSLENYQVPANKTGIKQLHKMLSSAGLGRAQRQQWMRANLGGEKKASPLTEGDWVAGKYVAMFRLSEPKPGKTSSLAASKITLKLSSDGRISISNPRTLTDLPRGNELAVVTRLIEHHGYSTAKSKQIAEARIAEARTGGAASLQP